MIKSKFKIITPIYLCHPSGRFASSGEVASPNYDPCVRFRIIKRPKDRLIRPKYWGNSILSKGSGAPSGYVYSPYIPVLISPPSFKISSRLIKAKSRKLNTKWSLYRDPIDLVARGAKRRSWTIVYNHVTKKLYDLRRDGQLIRIKVKKRCLKRIIRLIDGRKFKILTPWKDEFFFPKKKVGKITPIINSKMYGIVTVTNL